MLSDNDVVGLYAKITMLEFAIEVMMANELSENSEETSSQFKADFIERMSRQAKFITGDLDAAQTIQNINVAAAKMAENLISKVSQREAEIRDKKR